MYNFWLTDFKLILPELFILSSISLLLLYGVFLKDSKLYLINNVSWLSIQTLFITILLIINNPINNILIFQNSFIIDNLTTFIKIAVLFSTIATIIISLDYFKDENIQAFEYTLLILLAVTGMLLIISSYDFIALYLAIELQSLCLYVLAAFKRNSEFSTEAGLKYFVLGAFSSGLFLFGCSFIYGFTGITNFGDLAKLLTGFQNLEGSHGLIIGIIFITVALLFKIAAAPFHQWAPDVYEGAPTSVTAFFAIVPKIAVLGVFLRLFFYTFYDFIDIWQNIFIFCSITSMLLGVFAALYQQKIKRFLAYSAISHSGYILIGLCTGTILGIQGLLFYTVVYIIMSINIFCIVLALRKQENLKKIIYISELNGLAKVNPILAFSLAVVLFSMAGIPPLVGFYSKFYLFSAAIESKLYILALVGIFSSAVATFYYIRLIKIMFFENVTSTLTVFKQMDKEKSLVLASTFLFILLFFIYPTPFMIAIHKASLTLCL
jgi:proton-translocating NADH-quinone oxidoreductase chain N